MDDKLQNFLDDCIAHAEAVFSRSDLAEFLTSIDSEESADSVISDLIPDRITEVALKDMAPHEQRILGFDPDCEDSWQQDEDNRTFRVVYEIEKPKKREKKRG